MCKQGRLDKEARFRGGEEKQVHRATARRKLSVILTKEREAKTFGSILELLFSAAACRSSSHGAGLSDGGGDGRPEATSVHSLEVHAKAGSLVSVRGEHHHDFIHLCRCHHDHEFGEKRPGQKNETKRQLESKGPGHCLYCRNGSPHFHRLNPSNFTSTLPRRGDSFN